VDDGILEEYNVHLLNLGLLVVGLKFLDEVCSQQVEFGDLFVVRGILRLKEVNKDGICFSLGHAVVFVFHLEVLLQLFVKNSLEFNLICNGDETITEDSHDLVAPKFDEVLLGVLVSLLGHVETLEDLRDITHVENVMGVSGRGQEPLRDSVEQLDGSDCEVFAESFDLLREVVELEGGEGLKDSL